MNGMDRLGLPSFGGFMLGNSDIMMIINFFGKFKGKLVSLFNTTIIGGYRNV